MKKLRLSKISLCVQSEHDDVVVGSFLCSTGSNLREVSMTNRRLVHSSKYASSVAQYCTQLSEIHIRGDLVSPSQLKVMFGGCSALRKVQLHYITISVETRNYIASDTK